MPAGPALAARAIFVYSFAMQNVDDHIHIPPEQPDFLGRIQTAWSQRAAFHQGTATNAYRIFHGYSEGCPGLTIDRYNTAAIINHKVPLPEAPAAIAAELLRLFPFDHVVLKSHQTLETADAGAVRNLHGAASAEVLQVLEHGDHYFADPVSLHSNGLYLDARPLRVWLKQHSDGRRILNLFAHTGSLGIAARLGGAKEVVHLDKSREALERIQHSYKLNGLAPDSRGLLRGDIYHHLPRAIKWGQTFDGIILDPPPKVPPPPHAPKHRPDGQDFETLIALCCKLLAPGSWLACICHDFRMTHAQFDEHIIHASKNRLVPSWRSASDGDFPEDDPERRTRMTVFQFR